VAKRIFWTPWLSQGWMFGLTRWSKLLFLAYCFVIVCHKSDEHSAAASTVQHSQTLELTYKHDKHLVHLTASCY